MISTILRLGPATVGAAAAAVIEAGPLLVDLELTFLVALAPAPAPTPAPPPRTPPLLPQEQDRHVLSTGRTGGRAALDVVLAGPAMG